LSVFSVNTAAVGTREAEYSGSSNLADQEKLR
jgi:hypothetical protein